MRHLTVTLVWHFDKRGRGSADRLWPKADARLVAAERPLSGKADAHRLCIPIDPKAPSNKAFHRDMSSLTRSGAFRKFENYAVPRTHMGVPRREDPRRIWASATHPKAAVQSEYTQRLVMTRSSRSS